ncbi:putative receptor protein kinase ZmPK1 isoform X2 [Phragmites australis]|uniref:putative receptor protein kinase ZmPK1 isoform X2 n=1 Tax=Phragmites australis TaxID=29695 RepID=UPI002D776278|nr:putative receptor protein kinase ZmPK1 isoform X2 [Phragmites australis]
MSATMVPSLSILLATASILSFFALFPRAASRDILPLGSSLTVEAYQTNILQSSDGTFSCGFYSVYTNAFTFSIWYSKAANKTMVWSANPNRPVHARRSAVTLQKDGNMVLTDYDSTVVWKADGNFTNVRHAQLLNTGNLIIKDSSGSTLWQSFDSPTDTFLPTQHITATAKLVPTTQSHSPGPNIKRRLTLDPDGNLRLYSLNDSDGSWSVSMQAMSQPCNIHGSCGPNGICHYSPQPTCSCPPGYVMSNQGNWTEGCTSIVNITCDHHDHESMKFVKLPNTDFWGSDQQHLLSVSFQTCRNICIHDCTCKGFQYQEGTGSCYPKAYLFSGRTYPTPDVRTIYLKLPTSVNISSVLIPRSNVFDSVPHQLDCAQMNKSIIEPFPDVHKTGGGESKWFYFYGFIAAFFVVETSFITFAWFFVLRRELRPSELWAAEEGYKVMTSNFRRYSYRELVKATSNLKVELGRGGSGTVYKGVLEDDRPVAVKKLENIKQGKEEFQAELSIIGKINHMNLVRIWGFCSEGSHRLLVSEYVENGSLANILFNEKNNIVLDWKGRFNIALGVAKGLAYLHHECLEWVIHCDVKPENILLDQNFEPKITDFGLAKLLNRRGSNQNVSHVRGTLGYIAPEWVSGLPITAKVDVYSYGVVILELLSGTRVTELVEGSDEVYNMLRKLVRMLADKLQGEEHSWIDGLLDSKLNRPINCVQARTLIKLAVSCLEEDRGRRPTMESIVQTLLSVDD